MNYSELLTTNTRSDDYVNATKLCATFGKEFRAFSQMKETKEYVKVLASRLNISQTDVMEVKRGKGGGTYVHPFVALALAEWLSPDFHLAVLDIFKRYLEADPELAISIIERQTNVVDAKRIEARAKGKVARLGFTNELQHRGVVGNGYALNTNAIYDGVFGLDAVELKDKLQVANPRDGMSSLELAALEFAELKAVAKMREAQATGNAQTIRCSRAVAQLVGQALMG